MMEKCHCFLRQWFRDADGCFPQTAARSEINGPKITSVVKYHYVAHWNDDVCGCKDSLGNMNTSCRGRMKPQGSCSVSVMQISLSQLLSIICDFSGGNIRATTLNWTRDNEGDQRIKSQIILLKQSMGADWGLQGNGADVRLCSDGKGTCDWWSEEFGTGLKRLIRNINGMMAMWLALFVIARRSLAFRQWLGVLSVCRLHALIVYVWVLLT